MNREYSQLYKKNFQFLGVTTPSYLDTTIIGPATSSNLAGTYIPIPFSYKNGLLDINIQNNVEANLINPLGMSPTNFQYTTVKEMGGLGQVTSLGPNMIKWLTNWLSSTYPGPIFSVNQSATVVKLQMPLESTNLIDGSNDLFSKKPNALIGYQTTFTITPSAPTTNFVTGSQNTNFFTFWAFRTPLVVKVDFSGGTVFVTLNSSFGYSGG
jgi:hypothetical protein